MKVLKILFIILTINSCESTKTNNKTKMDKNNLEYKSFIKQNNRFELNACELKYNDKPFSLGMTIEEIKNVFGKNDKVDVIKERNEKRLLWKNKNISITFLSGKAIYIYIYIKKDIYRIYNTEFKMEFQGISSIIYNNHILHKNEKMQDFIKKSKLKFDDFMIDTNGYRDIKYCTNDKIRIFLSSSVVYYRIGSGHLYTQGDWKLDETNPIEAISISYIDK